MSSSQLPTHRYLVIMMSHQTQAPLSPNYVPKTDYPEYLAPSDAKAPMEDQPLPDDTSHTTLSLGYVADSDSEEDPKEDRVDYPSNGGDDASNVSSNDDDDDDDYNNEEQEASEDDDEEKEEHLGLADSFAVQVDDPVPSAKETEAFETDESAPTHIPSPRRRTAMMYVRPQILMSDSTEALIAEFKFGERSSAAAARQVGHTLAYTVDYGFIVTLDASIRPFESRAMTAMGVVNDRVTYLATTQRQDAQELYVCCEDAHDDRALLGAQVHLNTSRG
nr:hypothetical protein [Tanacetum cinerariifolium]